MPSWNILYIKLFDEPKPTTDSNESFSTHTFCVENNCLQPMQTAGPLVPYIESIFGLVWVENVAVNNNYT